MSSTKRKASADERPSKKPKSISKDQNQHSKIKPDGTQKKSTTLSILQQEERAFPRGGGSVLTPIEHRQIQAQAERDALFEEENGTAGIESNGNDNLFQDEQPKEGKKKRKPNTVVDKSGIKPEGSGVKIQGLSYKTLAVGSTVLGRVTAVTSKDVALALPNNLTGYVPIVAVSSALNTRIEKLLADEDDAMRGEEDDQDVDLKQMFHVGQWLRAAVTSTSTESESGERRSKRHIELSLNPMTVNRGLEADRPVDHTVVQASVRSVEDHGVIMDLGLSDADVKGFISKKELGVAFELDRLQNGQVLMCIVTGNASNGKVLKLSPDPSRFSVLPGNNKSPVLSTAPTVDAFLPGTAVQALITESSPGGVVGKLMGMLDVTAELVHSGAWNNAEGNAQKYRMGSKHFGRVIWSIPRSDGSRSVGISLLEQALTLMSAPSKLPLNATPKMKNLSTQLDQILRTSAVVKDAKVTRVMAERGLFFSLPDAQGQTFTGFAHISQISDTRIDSLDTASGRYVVDSSHDVRIISYNPIDNLYYVSMKKSVLDQKYLRLEDVVVGAKVRGTIEKLIIGGRNGVNGLLVNLSDSVTGLIPEMHLSDTQLEHPERKFREGLHVSAKVLSVDLEKRHLRLTLKKSLIDEQEQSQIWDDYQSLNAGMEANGTVINVQPKGAVIQFYGVVRAWLPVAEMSDAFIDRPEQYFRLGQTVKVRILSVNAETQEMMVSCKAGNDWSQHQQAEWDQLHGGSVVEGVVSEKAAEVLTVELESGIKGLIRVGHLLDGSASKAEGALKRIRVGQKLSNLLVLNKQDRSRLVTLSNKTSMIDDAKSGRLISSLATISEGVKVHGFVRNITSTAVFVEFANEVVGLLPQRQIVAEQQYAEDFGLRKDQSISVTVTSVEAERARFSLSMRDSKLAVSVATDRSTDFDAVSNPVDSSIKTSSDFSLGKITKARIMSVKATQINVRLADNVQGRIDVSEAFDAWDDFSNKGFPLQQFKQNEIVDVRILGIHDSRNHRFLPISHRQGKHPVYELSAKQSRIKKGDESLLTLDTVHTGSSHIAFINNHGDDCVWVNLSPNVRGRVALIDLSDDVGQLQKVENKFRVGSALRVKVKAVDIATNRLDLTARHADEGSSELQIRDLLPGMVIPGRVTKISERAITVQVSDSVAGPVPLVEMSDDFDNINISQYTKNDILRVSVVDVDVPNKKVYLSLRPSKVLSSSLPVKDLQIQDYSNLQAGDIVRGFVKNVGDKGVIVSLGARVDAFVRVSDLSDQYVKDWHSLYQIDELVQGRIQTVESASRNVQMTLKASLVDSNYRPPIGLSDLEAGMIVTGKVRKVEDFGAFIDIDDTKPRLSGLCHRSEIAARRVEDVRKIYTAGDIVKAKVLNVDVEKRKISLGLKASYFEEQGETQDVDMESDLDDEVNDGVGINTEDESEDTDGGIDVTHALEAEDDEEDNNEIMNLDEPLVLGNARKGLKTTGFDWNASGMDKGNDEESIDSEQDDLSKKRKRKKQEIQVDKTGDMDKYGPRNTSDFERQLLGQPNDSGLWIQYMAFQLELSEVQKARDIADRALRTIHIRETDEKANMWVAWLNLESEYGDNDHVDEVFKQACQVQDPLEMHEKLASIYIDSGKHDKADELFSKMVGNKNFRASPDLWLNYATFLLNKLNAPDRARALLSRALQSIPATEHRLLTAKFAALEFHSANGDAERGRTIFESILSEWSKWSSGWDMWADLERARLSAQAQDPEAKAEAQEKVRALFERMAAQKMKKRRAKFVFKKWLAFEETEGTPRQAERVTALAKEYAEKLQATGDGEDEAE